MKNKLVEYVLGELSEEDRIRLEQEYFDDEEKYLELKAKQDEILDAYVRGTLSADERDKFEKQIRGSPGLQRRVVIARAVAEHVSSPVPPEPSPSAGKNESRWSRVAAFFRFSPLAWRPVAVAFGVVAVMIAVVLGFQVQELRNRLEAMRAGLSAEQAKSAEELRRRLETEQARTNELSEQLAREQRERADLERKLAEYVPPPTVSESILSFALSPILTRDGEGLKRLDIPKEAERIELKLKLRETQYRKFNAELQTLDGQTVWSQKGLTRTGKGSGAFVVVRVETAKLPEDNYMVVLEGVAADGTSEVVGQYSFSAAPK